MSKLKLEGKFHEGGTFRLFDIPVGLDGQALLKEDITSFDVRVYDRDATKPFSPKENLYLISGNPVAGVDPGLTNPISGLDYFLLTANVAASKPTFRTGDGWTADDNGYVFVYDVDSSLWSRVEGGHTYSIEITYSSKLDGQVFLKALMTAINLQSE